MKKSSTLYFSLISLGFLFIVIGMLSIVAIAFIEKDILLIIGLSSIGIGAIIYIITIILYFVRRRKNKWVN